MRGTKRIQASSQARLFDYPGSVENVALTFKKLYFHLYTNGQASRAERIIADLSLLLLSKLALEVNGGSDTLKGFMAGSQSSDELLLPLLRNTYPGFVEPHERFGMGDDALRESFAILESVRLSDSPAHVLGDAFQAVIGPRLRGDKGQFFTPRSLVRAMVNTVSPRPHESVLDPACGTGGFLAEAHLFQKAQGGAPTGGLVGIDKDQDLCRISSALLTILCGERSEVLNFNSLAVDHPRLSGPENGLFDVILTNPPFGARIGIRDREILRHYDLAYQWVQRTDSRWQRTSVLSSVQDPQILFLELCVNRLKSGGRLGIVLPEGIFGNRRTAFIWQWLRSKGKITALLDCPRTTFQPGTDTKTNVLFFERSQDESGSVGGETVRVAVALACGHDRRGRTHYQDGRPYPDHFANLNQENGPAWVDVRLTHSDYVVPRYYVHQQFTREEEALTTGAQFVTLGQLKERKVISIRKGHEVGSHAYGSGDIPFVRTSDVNNFEVSVDPTNSVNEELYAEYARQQKLRPGDVLMVVDGRYRIGATALLTPANYRCVVQSHFRIISIADEAVIDPYELMFALALPSVKLRIRNLVFVQSTLGTLGDRLLELEIPLLHGNGPWTGRVAAFREALKKRDESLALLRRMTGPEPEL